MIIEAAKGGAVYIGRLGENEARTIRFPIRAMLDNFPGCTFALLNRRPGDADAYPSPNIAVNGDSLDWTVTSGDLTKVGFGECEITASVNSQVVKSEIYQTVVKTALDGSGTVPEPWESWVSEVTGAVEHYPKIENGVWMVWDTENETWASTGVQAEGQPGRDGQDGAPGADGKDGKDGQDGKDGKDGQDGADGYSPTASVSKSGKVSTFTVTDKNGTTSVQINDGEDGSGADIIDDTAGSGDTDKVWSADKTYGEFSDVKSAITQTPSMKDSDEENADLDISDEDGNVLARLEDGHIKTKKFDSKYAIHETGSDHIGDLDFSDPDGNVLLRVDNGEVLTKNFNSKNHHGILYRNMDIIDGIYAACRYGQRQASDKQFCLLLAGDIHGDTTRMKSIVEFANAHKIAFDAGVMLGDISATNYNSPIDFYVSALGDVEIPFVTVIGNHDAGFQGTVYDTEAHLYEKMIAPIIGFADLASGEHTTGNTYYYKDFTDQSIRLIVLNQYEYPDNFERTGSPECYSQAQITWLCNTLNSTPSGYGVIIALHSYPAAMTVDADHLFTSSTYTADAQDFDGGLVDHTNGYIIEEIVNAFINKTTISATFSYTGGITWDDISVSADFTSVASNAFIAYIGGHWHMTIVSETTKYGQPMFTCTSASLSASKQGDTPRMAGTRSEDNFMVIGIDRTAKKIKLLQIGARFTKDGVTRQYGAMEYGGAS